MSQYQNQYGAQSGNIDEYGNPVNQLDQYGNPVSGGGYTGEAGRQHFGNTDGATGHGHGHGQQHRGVDQNTGTGYGTNTGVIGGYATKPDYGSTNTGSGYGTGTGYGGTGTTEYVREDHHGDKKGVMDKIKEKIPGTEQSRTNTEGTGYGTTGYGASGGGIGNTGGEYVREEHHGDKKGVMDKIKEKIPGTEQSRTNTERTGYGTTTGYGASGGGIGNTGEGYVREEHHVHHGDQQHGEKKGIMDKIKEKIPGTGACTGH